MTHFSSRNEVKGRGSWFVCAILTMLMFLGTGLTASAAPQLKGFNYSSEELFFPYRSDTVKVYYTEPVTKTYWAMEQDGKEVLSGTCTGKDQNQPYATINMKAALGTALANGDIKLGKVNMKITKVEYDGDQEAENLGAVEWNITDAPLCNSMNPYPVPEGNNISEIKSNTTCSYSAVTGNYMGNTPQVVQVKARIVQNGMTLAEEVIFNGTKSASTGKYGYQASNKLANDPVWSSIDAGVVEIQFYEVTYLSPINGEEKVLNVQPALPAKSAKIGSGTYQQLYTGVAITKGVKTAPAESDIIAESLPEYTGEIRSYYAADGTEGVITYTSKVAVDPSSLRAELSYGQMDMPFTKRVPVSVSEDGKQVIVDLRGMLNNARTITNGYEFRDDNGNPTAAPTQIALELTGLNSVSGGQLCTIWKAPDGSKSVVQYGKMWRNYAFNDITFANPKLVSAQFYDSAKPEVKSDAIIASSNTVDLTVNGDDVITTADVVFTAGEVKEAVAYADVKISEGVWTMTLPETVKAAGSSDLVISLENVVYNKEDGETHVIEPLDVAKNGGAVKQVATVAELKALDDNTLFLLNTETLKVTLCDADMGLAMVEDETGGLMLDPSSAALFAEGKLVKGIVSGTYIGTSVVSVDAEKSNFQLEDTDISTGLLVEEAAELVSDDNIYRLLTVNASEDITLVYSEDAEGVLIAEMVTARDALGRIPADYVYPANIASVTGVVYSVSGQSFLIVRSVNDIVEAARPIEGIAEALANMTEEPFTMHLTDAKVTCSVMGMSFVEDATGASRFVMADGESDFGIRGQLLNGDVMVMNYGGVMLVALDNSGLTVGEADVTLGKVITGSQVKENASRLVTFTAENSVFDVDTESNVVMVDAVGIVADMFGVLSEDYVWPEKIQSLTGVVYKDLDMGTCIVMIRDANDIVAGTPAETSCASIAELKALPEGSQAVLKLNGAKITHAFNGINFLEDETGAIMIPEVELPGRGKALTGTIKGVNYGQYFVVEDASHVVIESVEDVDVQYGIRLTASELTNSEHHWRLVTLSVEDGHQILSDDDMGMIMVGDYAFAVDQFGVLSPDYKYPETIKSVTGILWPMDGVALDLDDETPAMPAILVIRDANDIENGKQDSISGVLVEEGQTVGDVYSVSGVKVRQAGESLQSLPTGIYIINGQKIFLQN